MSKYQNGDRFTDGKCFWEISDCHRQGHTTSFVVTASRRDGARKRFVCNTHRFTRLIKSKGLVKA